MIEVLAIVIFGAGLSVGAGLLEAADNLKRRRQPKAPAPGTSSQRPQIKPLTSAQVALGKKAYLGPKRPRSAEFYRDRRTKKAVRKLPF